LDCGKLEVPFIPEVRTMTKSVNRFSGKEKGGCRERIIYRKADAVCLIVVAAIVVAVPVLQGVALAPKDSMPKGWDKLALGECDAEQLVLPTDTDQNGKLMNHKVTKQEWMTFMEAEFDRLDHNQSGAIDAVELAKSMRLKYPANTEK
jgi:hypothetical protein